VNKITKLAVFLGVCTLLIVGLANAEVVQSTLWEYNQARIQRNLSPISGNPNTPLLCDLRSNNGTEISCEVMQQGQYQPPAQQRSYQNPSYQIIPLPRLDPNQSPEAAKSAWDKYTQDTQLQKQNEDRRQAIQNQEDTMREGREIDDYNAQLRRVERIYPSH
jgi:hypothetical protein